MDTDSVAPKSPPVRYSERIAAAICAKIAEGGSLRAVCREQGMPSFQTVLRWAHENREGFRERYVLAIDFRAQALAEELLEIADAAPAAATGAPGTGEASAKVQAAKLQVDARKWLLARLAPKRYGDRVALEYTGADGGPIETRGEYRVTPEDEEAIQRIAEARAKLRAEREGGRDDAD